MQIIEHYTSIQGEGLHTGQRTYFVRFAGCNLRCTWCDSKFTFGKGKTVSFRILVRSIRKSRAKLVCVTGGEPLLHEAQCIRLIRELPAVHFDIETGGALDIRGVQFKNTSVIMDWKLEHSGMKHQMKFQNLKALRPDRDLLKLVTDGSRIEKKQIVRLITLTAKYGFPISIQPVFGTSYKKLADWTLALKNPKLRFNLQLHKQIWPPNQRRT